MIKFHLVRNFRKKANWLERFFAHFLLIAGGIKISFRNNFLERSEYSKIAGKLERGDLVFVGSKREISRFFLRGDLTHVLIYIGRKKFIHSSVKNGVEGIYLKDIFDNYDFLEAYRHADFSTKKQKQIMKFLLKSYGKAYDFRFLQNNRNEFYCTKLAELAYKSAGIKIKKRRESTILPYLSTTHPEDFLLHDFELVYASQRLRTLKKKWDFSKIWDIFSGSFLETN